MYWDGCFIDGVKLNKGKLIASGLPKSVEILVKKIN